MIKYIYTTIALVCMAIFGQLHAQTASSDSGCIPLDVQFTASDQSTYFWDFKDGATSNLQNPQHIFTSAGDYEVELYTSQGGSLVGTVNITVYPDLIVNISANPISGCTPLDVTFTPEIIKDPEIDIISVVWTFGDGGSSTQLEPTYTYKDPGTFPISIKVVTSVTECDKTIQFDDEITVAGVDAKFTSNKFSSCNSPDVFNFTNTTVSEPDHTYEWDFGNGETFSGYQPGPITYTEDGLYEITLSVNNSTGCISTATRFINIGPPVFNLDFDEVICFSSATTLANNTVADEFFWEFEDSPGLSAINSDSISPTIFASQTGVYEVKLTATSLLGCTSDTTFNITVDVVNANFELGPDVTCGEEFTVILEAEDLNHDFYTWTEFNPDGSDFTTNLPTAQQTYEAPERDSFYVNYPDTLFYELVATSQYGCKDSVTNELIIRRPEAFFIPDEIVGLDELTVNFEDLSFSEQPIVERIWDWGDGTSDTFTDELFHTHTYGPGCYWVRLTIRNEAGCIDESELVKITVISLDDLPTGSATANGQVGDLQICVGDSVTVLFLNPAPNLIDFHFNTDLGRFDQCWKSDTGTHAFLYPGEFTMGYTLEHEGMVFHQDRIGELTIDGAHSKIGYETDCDDIFNVDFESKSINANRLEWYIDGQMVSTAANFTHNFTDLGEHFVELHATDTNSPCDAHVDTTTVHITQIKADFEVQKNMCDSTMYLLDASASLDVHDDCHEGYLWNFDFNRPREVGEDSLYHQFPRGRQAITLITEDINGCKDELTKMVNVYGMDGEFPLDTSFCLPHFAQLEDQTNADTTVVGWEWSFGSEEESPIYVFSESDLDSLGNLAVSLIVTDAIGCTEEIVKEVELYEPISSIEVNRGPFICTGSSVIFSADDYNEQGSFLTYSWDFGQYGMVDGENPEITFTEPGETEVTLTFTEDSSGCMGDTTITINAIAAPEADFMTSVDTLDQLCHPETIEFTNLSQTEGPVFYNWNFGNGVTSGLEDPAISYDKGTFTTTMIVRSIYGCSDTLMQTFELVGPEGLANIDKPAICLGEEVTLTLTDPVDVSSFTWDLGDGNTVDDVSPYTHVYDLETNLSLILRSTNTGCELIQTIPIEIDTVFADFELAGQEGACNGIFSLQNLSINADSYQWVFGDQTATGANPTFDFENPGDQEVMLTVSNNSSGCENSILKTIELEGEDKTVELPNVFSPNSDSRNDFFNFGDDLAMDDIIDIVDFKIYNRWGQLIYDNATPDTGWNGFYDNKIAPAEVYSYFIEYSINGCNNKTKKGNLTLVR